MVVDILLLLAGLVFGINDPDVNNRYVEYSPGNTNLVFTVPHDGQIKLDSIPIRQNGCRDVVGGVCNYPSSEDCMKPFLCKAILYSDSNTYDFTKRARAAFTKRTGLVPHLIVSKLHRSQLDPNRPIEDAAQGSPEAEAAYREFHDTIRRVQVHCTHPYGEMFAKTAKPNGYIWAVLFDKTAKSRKPWLCLACCLTSMGRGVDRTAQCWATSTRNQI